MTFVALFRILFILIIQNKNTITNNHMHDKMSRWNKYRTNHLIVNRNDRDDFVCRCHKMVLFIFGDASRFHSEKCAIILKWKWFKLKIIVGDDNNVVERKVLANTIWPKHAYTCSYSFIESHILFTLFTYLFICLFGMWDRNDDGIS